MRHVIVPLILVASIMLAGCSLLAPTQVPTSTPTTAFFIRVPTPTGSVVITSTPEPTLEPTLSVTATVNVPTDTPVPTTVSELPAPAGYVWQLVVDGLQRPEGLVNSGDGSGRLFILE